MPNPMPKMAEEYQSMAEMHAMNQSKTTSQMRAMMVEPKMMAMMTNYRSMGQKTVAKYQSMVVNVPKMCSMSQTTIVMNVPMDQMTIVTNVPKMVVGCQSMASRNAMKRLVNHRLEQADAIQLGR